MSRIFLPGDQVVLEDGRTGVLLEIIKTEPCAKDTAWVTIDGEPKAGRTITAIFVNELKLAATKATAEATLWPASKEGP